MTSKPTRTLKEQLMSLREFDAPEVQTSIASHDFKGVVVPTPTNRGAMWQHAKNQKLFELLCDVAVAADEVCAADDRRDAGLGSYIVTQEKALSALKAHIAKEQA